MTKKEIPRKKIKLFHMFTIKKSKKIKLSNNASEYCAEQHFASLPSVSKCGQYGKSSMTSEIADLLEIQLRNSLLYR